MPYLVSSIIAIVTALIILMTRYEADDSTITSEIERAKSMFITIDGFVNTYIQSGGDMTQINFQKLYGDGILLGNLSIGTTDSFNVKVIKLDSSGATNIEKMSSSLKFMRSNIIWQIVPIVIKDTIKDSSGANKSLDNSVGAGYKLLVDFSKENSLMSKNAFSENFFGKEVCEKTLFGSFINDAKTISSTNQTLTLDGKNSDGKFACIVFK